jgi:predicted small metal-binding protein
LKVSFSKETAMTVISNEVVATGPVVDYVSHVLTVEAPESSGGCGDVSCCDGPVHRSWCSCGQHTMSAHDTDFIRDEHAEHVAEVHGLEQVDEDKLRVVWE